MRILTLLLLMFPTLAGAVTLTLDRTIELASDSSLMAFRYHNQYQADYWQWVSYRAQRLPSLSLDLIPASYNRYMTQRYDSQQNIDIYRQQQMYSASAGLSISQNFDLLGGSFFAETDLNFMRNFGNNTFTQYSTVPVRIGYRQSLIGFNKFKWDRRIEPIKYEKARLELAYNMESVSEQAVRYFFDLALAQAEFKLAEENVASCDTLYTIGERRYKIAAISHADLLTLQLDKVNARNNLENCRITLQRAMFSMASFLGFEKNTHIDLVLPGRPAAIDIPTADAITYAKLNNPTLIGHKASILEAERDVNRTTVESRFNASINASVGFNQVADNLSRAYSNLLRQDIVQVSISVPLVDWGVRKGKINMAKNNLNIARIQARQDELSIEEDVIMTVSDYNVRRELVSSASEALDLAEMAYAQTQQRFIIGKADVNAVTMALNRRREASKNFVSALQNYWASHYKIRRLTLYDFSMGLPLTDIVEYKAFGIK